jgi:hypothetical protein
MGTLSKDSRSLVVDLINGANGTSFDYTALVFSPPSVNDPVVGNRNTLINVTATDSEEFAGNINVYYDRLDFGVLFAGITVTVGGLNITDISGVLPEINATYGLDLTLDDVADLSLANLTYPATLTVTASPNSYVYFGQFQIVVQNIAPQLTDNIVTVLLPGFTDNIIELADVVIDIQNLAGTVLAMTLATNNQNDVLRALTQDVTLVTETATLQAVEINGINDEIRQIESDLTKAATAAAAAQAANVVTQTEVTALQTQVTELVNAPASAPPSAPPPSGPTKASVVISGTGTQIVGTVIMPKIFLLLKFLSDTPCRLRLYPTAAERDADLSRGAGVSSTPGASLLFEGTSIATLLSFNTGPAAWCYNDDDVAEDMIYYTLEPASGGESNVTLTYYGFLT